jgi:phosphatidylglycerol:prolipoprotein diacylglycerol transferase
MFHWNIDPVLLHLGPLQIHWYGLIFALGLVVAYSLGEYILKREGKDVAILEPLFLYVVIGLIVGARLAHVLFYDLDYYLANPIEIFKVWHGGLASHGGFLGLMLALWLFSKKYNISIKWLLARATIPAMFVAGCIRVGNFFNSEIVGKATDGSWGVIFDRVDAIPRHPVVLYESISYFLIFAILFWLYHKVSFERFSNIALGLTFILGFGARFVLEHFKTAQSEFATALPVTMGQLLSVPFILIGLYLLLRGLKK